MLYFADAAGDKKLIKNALAIRVGVFYLLKASEGYAVTDQFYWPNSLEFIRRSS